MGGTDGFLGLIFWGAGVKASEISGASSRTRKGSEPQHFSKVGVGRRCWGRGGESVGCGFGLWGFFRKMWGERADEWGYAGESADAAPTASAGRTRDRSGRPEAGRRR